MMSDHWKAIARLLGAAGATDPAAQAAKGPAAPETSAAPTPVEPAPERSKSVRRDEVKKEIRGKVGSAGGGDQFGGGLLEEVTASAESVGSGPGHSSENEAASVVDVTAEKKTGDSTQEKGDDLLNFSSFNSLDDQREEPARRLFGTPKGRSQTAEKKASGVEGVAGAESLPEGEAPRGLDRIFGEPEATNEPSSWDKLVDRLGVEVPEEVRSEAAAASSDAGSTGTGRGRERSASPSSRGEQPRERQKDEPKQGSGRGPAGGRLKDEVGKAARGPVGFGSGLGLDLPDDDLESMDARPFGAAEVVAEEPGAESRRGSGRSDSGRSDSGKLGRVEIEKDPLEELGGEGWGQPSRGRGPKLAGGRPQALGGPATNESREESASDDPEEGFVGHGDRGRGVRGRGEDRSEGGSDSRRRESRGPSRGSREGLGSRDHDDVVDSSAGASTSQSKGAVGGGKSEDGGPPRRGRRRGQRQRMGEDLTGSVEFEKRGPARRQEVELDEEEFVSNDDPMDGVTSRSSGEDDSETPTRRRRRRGRRRRGGTDSEVGGVEDGSSEIESGEEPRVAGKAEHTQGRAIDAEFDDDHEDDEEAVALRRSRRRRRRRGGEPVEAKDDGLGESDVVDIAGEASGDDDQEAVSYNVQRNVPTWLTAVEILVNSNMDARKRDPRRSGGGSSSGSGGRNRPRR